MHEITGRPEQQSSKWGLSEAELFLSKGAPTEGSGLGMEAMEAGSEGIVTRRLVIGIGITALAVGLANVRVETITVFSCFYCHMVPCSRHKGPFLFYFL